jgi:D-arabinose 1-dehydrogenase-like Zn-dependent alcohol dehydrogenase
MLYGAAAAATGAFLITSCNARGWLEEARWIGILGVGGLGTFGIAAAKAWGVKPSFYTGILLFLLCR